MTSADSGKSPLGTSTSEQFKMTTDAESPMTPSKIQSPATTSRSQPILPARAAVVNPFAEESDYATWKSVKKGTLPTARSLNFGPRTQTLVPERDLSAFPDMGARSTSDQFVYTIDAGPLLGDTSVDQDSEDDVLGKGKKPKQKVLNIF